MLSRKILSWNDFDFNTNDGVAGQDLWYDLLTFEVSQKNLRRFFTGKGYQMKVPTADQDTGVDCSSPDSVTVSLTNSIPDISGLDLEYQVQAFVDDQEYPVSSIDSPANEVTVDVTDSSNSDADVTVFYISDSSQQFFRWVVEATSKESDSFVDDDLGALHSLNQRSVEQRQEIQNDLLAPEFFFVKLQVNSDVSYITDPTQVSGLNDHSIETDVKKLILPHKMQGIEEYIRKQGTPGTRQGVKEAVIQTLTH